MGPAGLWALMPKIGWSVAFSVLAIVVPSAVADGYVELEPTTVQQSTPGVAMGTRSVPVPTTSQGEDACTGGATVRICYPTYEFEGFQQQQIASPVITQESRTIPFYYVRAWSPVVLAASCASSGNAWTLALTTSADANADHAYETARVDVVAFPATWWGAFAAYYACGQADGVATSAQLLP